MVTKIYYNMEQPMNNGFNKLTDLHDCNTC